MFYSNSLWFSVEDIEDPCVKGARACALGRDSSSYIHKQTSLPHNQLISG